MVDCYITRTGSYLPGRPIENNNIAKYLGKVIGDSWVREKILSLNGIQSRHYALDEDQNPTHDVYDLAAEAVGNCLNGNGSTVEYLSAGATNTPLVAPGLLEPSVRGSGRPISRQTMIALEIDPSR